MANILGYVTIDQGAIITVDGAPGTSPGTQAPIGTIAEYDNGSVGTAYLKVGPGAMDWDQISTASASGVGQGDYLRLPIYDTNASGYHIDDTVLQNTKTIDVAIQAQPSRSANIEYRIPNPGDAISTADFILSEGAQTKNGDMTFNDNVVVNQNLTVNGALTYLNTTNTQITDKLITLNKGGGTASGSGTGFEFEEAIQATTTTAGSNPSTGFVATAVGPLGNGIVVTVTDSGGPGAIIVVEGVGTVSIDINGNTPNAAAVNPFVSSVQMTGAGNLVASEVYAATSGGIGSITGYLKTDSARDSFLLKAPASFEAELDLQLLTADRQFLFQNRAGVLALQTPNALTAASVPFIDSALKLNEDNTNFTWDNSASKRLSVANLTVATSQTISSFSTAGIVHNNASGVLSSSLISMTADVTGILPLANGGTNSSSAASAGSIVYSSASAMLFSSVGTAGQPLLSGGTGAPTWFSGTGVVHATAGVLSASAVSLTADVSGILPIANGGTNSGTALNGHRIMVSNPTGATAAIVEAAAMTDGQLLIGSTGAAPVVANIVEGTNQGVTIVNGAGSITLTTVQDIRTSASPQFNSALLTGAGSTFEIHDTTAALDMKIQMFTVPTTDATVTTIATISPALGTVSVIEARITGYVTGGVSGVVGNSCAYIRTARITRVAGNAILSNLQTDYSSEDVASFNGTITTSGTNVLVRVTGAAATNMTWKCEIINLV